MSKPTHLLTITLQFSMEEQDLYMRMLSGTKQEIHSLVRTGNTINRYNLLFTAILRMRMVCNLGTYSPAETVAGSLGKGGLALGCDCCTEADESATPTPESPLFAWIARRRFNGLAPLGIPVLYRMRVLLPANIPRRISQRVLQEMVFLQSCLLWFKT